MPKGGKDVWENFEYLFSKPILQSFNNKNDVIKYYFSISGSIGYIQHLRTFFCMSAFCQHFVDLRVKRNNLPAGMVKNCSLYAQVFSMRALCSQSATS
jgi:hypothetical protein